MQLKDPFLFFFFPVFPFYFANLLGFMFKPATLGLGHGLENPV
jgi:hypothetical protein